MAHAHHFRERTIGTQQRVDRLVAHTMRRFFTIILSASAVAFFLCCLGTIR